MDLYILDMAWSWLRIAFSHWVHKTWMEKGNRLINSMNLTQEIPPINWSLIQMTKIKNLRIHDQILNIFMYFSIISQDLNIYNLHNGTRWTKISWEIRGRIQTNRLSSPLRHFEEVDSNGWRQKILQRFVSCRKINPNFNRWNGCTVQIVIRAYE